MGAQLARVRRAAALTGSVILVAMGTNLMGLPIARAITPPSVDPTMVPKVGHPGPEEPMRRGNSCAAPVTLRTPDVSAMAPGFELLGISTAWKYSTGNGVPVAVIDTGVTPNPRLPVVPGGDFVMGEDGLQDCDAHGTVIASIIAAAPQGLVPMPPRMPPVPAFPTPEAPAAVTSAPLPPTDAPPPVAPPAPPAPVTIIQTATAPAPAPPPPASDAPPPEEPAAAPASDAETAQQAPVVPASGPGDPADAEDPLVPAPAPGAPDGVVGVAPHATIISIRQSSQAFQPVTPHSDGNQQVIKAGTLSTLASSVVTAANLGAKVINISVTACVAANSTLDQRELGAALWYAATVKDAVIVAAAGNVDEHDCANNPMFDPLNPTDPRDWNQVKVVSSPSWFSDYVLSVGAVDSTGAPVDKSMSGPWVSVAAPGTAIMGLSPQGGGPVNGFLPLNPGAPNAKNIPFWGTSFSAAYVSGVAALVRAKFPELSAHQIINRIVQTAHNPAGGVNNKIGYGMVDPVAALTFNIPPGEKIAPGSQSRVIVPAPPPPAPDHRARNIAAGFMAVIAAAVLIVGIRARLHRAGLR